VRAQADNNDETAKAWVAHMTSLAKKLDLRLEK
jgi:hypothetical protein